MHLFKTYILILLVLISFSCRKDKGQAKRSLRGEWAVTQAYSAYGEYTSAGFLGRSQILDNGDIGTFVFDKKSVSYSFMRNDSIFEGESEWKLKTDRIWEGARRVTQFTLELEDEFVFDVGFGNESKNAENKATKVVLHKLASEEQAYEIRLILSKR